MVGHGRCGRAWESKEWEGVEWEGVEWEGIELEGVWSAVVRVGASGVREYIGSVVVGNGGSDFRGLHVKHVQGVIHRSTKPLHCSRYLLVGLYSID